MKSLSFSLSFIAPISSCSRRLNEPNPPPCPILPNQTNSNDVDTLVPNSEGERDKLLFKNLLRSQTIYAYESFENPRVLHYDYALDPVEKLMGIEQWIVDMGGRKAVKTLEINCRVNY